MSKEVKTTSVDGVTADVAADAKVKASAKSKNVAKKENIFKRIWKKIVKLCKDTSSEMKKVVWTPKNELAKNTKLVLITVVAIGVVIAVFDTACSYIINTVAGLIG